MKEKIVKILMYISGAVCLLVFLSVRYEPLYNALLKEPIVDGYWEMTKYGELYYFSMISHFREEGLPRAQRRFEYSSKNAEVNEAEILTFGDSFFEISRHKQFPERLADDFNKKVHYANIDHPLDYLVSSHYTDTVPKPVIFEMVERRIPVAFEKEHVMPDMTKYEDPKPDRMIDKLLNLIFYERSEVLYDAMLKRSYATTLIYSKISTLKFDLFGYISKMTPTYKKDGDKSWLFYWDQVNEKRTSFYYQFTQEQIDSICDNMADLSKKMKQHYNLDLLYMPVPNKYTLYHYVLNNDPYNNFLPRLFSGLDKRGVKYLEFYTDFKACPDTIYYLTDDHWNQKGLDIGYNKTIDYIKSDSVFQDFFFNYLQLATR